MAAGQETGVGIGACSSYLSLVKYGYSPALLRQEVCGANTDRPAPDNKYVNLLGHPGIVLLEFYKSRLMIQSVMKPVSEVTSFMSEYVLSVWDTVMPQYTFTIQNPPSLT